MQKKGKSLNLIRKHNFITSVNQNFKRNKLELTLEILSTFLLSSSIPEKKGLLFTVSVDAVTQLCPDHIALCRLKCGGIG